MIQEYSTHGNLLICADVVSEVPGFVFVKSLYCIYSDRLASVLNIAAICRLQLLVYRPLFSTSSWICCFRSHGLKYVLIGGFALFSDMFRESNVIVVIRLTVL